MRLFLSLFSLALLGAALIALPGKWTGLGAPLPFTIYLYLESLKLFSVPLVLALLLSFRYQLVTAAAMAWAAWVTGVGIAALLNWDGALTPANPIGWIWPAAGVAVATSAMVFGAFSLTPKKIIKRVASVGEEKKSEAPPESAKAS